ncbi:MAG TPA: enoyl-CoA hydratase/isomerase family protein, partial [Kineosporiaceae bacterium]|nr:enoyl-CoA hydratase/isomerase family protein [Kineosporiaceae bacterium]
MTQAPGAAADPSVTAGPVQVPAEVRSLLGPAQVRVQVEGRRADVVLDAPERRNSQSPATWRALAAVGAWLPSVCDVAVLRAEGPSFSAGLDRRAFTPEGIAGEPGLLQLAGLPPAEVDRIIDGFQRAFTCWAGDGFVTVAAVQGHAVGAGFQLALACDLRIAADDAMFAMRETSLGLVPDLAGTSPLVAAVGYPRALEICATGRWVPAEEALRLGLVQQVVPVGGLAAAVDQLAGALLAAPRDALLATRTLLRDASG